MRHRADGRGRECTEHDRGDDRGSRSDGARPGEHDSRYPAVSPRRQPREPPRSVTARASGEGFIGGARPVQIGPAERAPELREVPGDRSGNHEGRTVGARNGDARRVGARCGGARGRAPRGGSASRAPVVAVAQQGGAGVGSVDAQLVGSLPSRGRARGARRAAHGQSSQSSCARSSRHGRARPACVGPSRDRWARPTRLARGRALATRSRRSGARTFPRPPVSARAASAESEDDDAAHVAIEPGRGVDARRRSRPPARLRPAIRRVGTPLLIGDRRHARRLVGGDDDAHPLGRGWERLQAPRARARPRLGVVRCGRRLRRSLSVRPRWHGGGRRRRGHRGSPERRRRHGPRWREGGPPRPRAPPSGSCRAADRRLRDGDVDRGRDRRHCDPSTIPRSPSTRTRSPVRTTRVAPSTLTTLGTPNSRATTAA